MCAVSNIFIAFPYYDMNASSYLGQVSKLSEGSFSQASMLVTASLTESP